MSEASASENSRVEPLCPVFGECGGCLYQDISYEEELRKKDELLKSILAPDLNLSESLFDSIEPSPLSYHYRHRLDLNLRRFKDGGMVMGFVGAFPKKIVPIESCAIARREISDFLPELKRQAMERLPADYRVASLCVKTSDDGRVLWGGIGRRSLRVPEEEYLWTEISGRRVYFSLDSFFQNNLAILPRFFDRLQGLVFLSSETVFFDLYGGVGLFTTVLAPKVKEAVLIEESHASLNLARFNARYHGLENVRIVHGKVEEVLKDPAASFDFSKAVAMVDPPRKGLHPAARRFLSAHVPLKTLLYLSCNPETLCTDLKTFLEKGWEVKKILPFDFFPRTRHLETLVLITRPEV